MSGWPTLEQACSFVKQGTGRGIRIAVLDSGIEATHTALRDLRLLDDVAVIERDSQISSVPGNQRDVFGHGTAIAGILRELAPEAEIGSFRVLGEQLRSRSLIIREGARLALERGYHILNCSFGCEREDHVLLFKDWVDQAYISGRHIVAASNHHSLMKREWPAHFPSVLTVSFSESAGTEAFLCRRGHLVEFAARGQDIEVAWLDGGSKKVTGSSFAAPRVAAILARLLSCCPDISPVHAKALMQRIAEPWARQSSPKA